MYKSCECQCPADIVLPIIASTTIQVHCTAENGPIEGKPAEARSYHQNEYVQAVLTNRPSITDGRCKSKPKNTSHVEQTPHPTVTTADHRALASDTK